MVALTEASADLQSLWTMFDFTGMAATFVTLAAHLDTTHMMLGGGTFDAAKAPLTLPAVLWSSDVVLMRCVSGAPAPLAAGDAVGFNGVANGQSVTAYLIVATAALAGGYGWNRRA